MKAYDEYIQRTKNAWKDEVDDSTDTDNKIVPSGGMIRVSILAMDSVQRSMHDSMPRLEVSPENKHMLDESKKQADRAAAWKDHFDSKRETITDSPRNSYIKRLSTVWQSQGAV